MKFEQNGLTYQLNQEEQTANVCGSNSNSETIFIPQTIDYQKKKYTVVRISSSSFKNNKSIKWVTFPENSELISIEDDAFRSSTLEKILIPSHVQTIGAFAFSSCANLQSFGFAENSELRLIDNSAFSQSSIESIVIPSQVRQIKQNAFNNCRSLVTVDFAENSELRSIENGAFSSTLIEKFTITSNVDSLKEGCFKNISKLATIEISPDNKHYAYIDDSLLLYKENEDSDVYETLIFASPLIKSVSIPSCVREIERYAFEGCKKLKTVQFPDDSNLLYINSYAFFESSITEIIIPPHVKQIGAYAFNNCKKLKNVKFSENSELRLIDSYSFSSTLITSIQIPSNVQQIGSYAFNNCQSLQSLTFSEDSQLIFIDGYSFFGSSIESVVIPPLVQKIGAYAFSSSQKLKNLSFASNSQLRSIESYAFSSSLIDKVTIPSNVQKIGDHAFSSCQKLRTISFLENSRLRSIDSYAFSSTIVEKILIPAHVRQIGDHAFAGCRKLKNFILPKNSELQTIENSAFAQTHIDKLTIPPNADSLKEGCLRNINNLKIIEILPGNKHYQYFNKTLLLYKEDENSDTYDILIYVRPDIEKVTIPSYVKEIEDFAFEGCKKLKYVNFAKDTKVNFICKNVFNGVVIDSITVPFSLSNVRLYLPNYKSIVKLGILDENVEINHLTFCGLDNLQKVSLPYAQNINIQNSNNCGKFELLVTQNAHINGLDESNKEENNGITVKRVPADILKDNIFISTDLLIQLTASFNKQ